MSQGILGTAREEECNFLLLGEPVATSLLERLFASMVERVLQDAPNQVGIVYGTIRRDSVRRVVVPITSGASSQLAAELAPGFAANFGAHASALTVIPTELGRPQAEALEREARETLRKAELKTDLQVLRRQEVGPGLVPLAGAWRPGTDWRAARPIPWRPCWPRRFRGRLRGMRTAR